MAEDALCGRAGQIWQENIFQLSVEEIGHFLERGKAALVPNSLWEVSETRKQLEDNSLPDSAQSRGGAKQKWLWIDKGY